MTWAGVCCSGELKTKPADGPDANFPTALERAGVEFIAGDATVGPGVRPHAMRASQPHKGVRSVQAIRLGERRNYKTKPNIAAHPRLRGFCQAKKPGARRGFLWGGERGYRGYCATEPGITRRSGNITGTSPPNRWSNRRTFPELSRRWRSALRAFSLSHSFFEWLVPCFFLRDFRGNLGLSCRQWNSFVLRS